MISDVKFQLPFTRNTVERSHRAVLAAALAEYTDWAAPLPSPQGRRHALQQLLGDALLLAPLHAAADRYAAAGANTFLFTTDLSGQLHGKVSTH